MFNVKPFSTFATLMLPSPATSGGCSGGGSASQMSGVQHVT
jgi:hypothetical protein